MTARPSLTRFCPVHPDEPLLDGRLDEVKYQLMEADDRARNKTYSIWLVVMILGCCLLSIVLMFLVHQLQLLQERQVFETEGYVDQRLIRHLQAA